MGDICNNCGKAFQGEYIKALGASWHPGCFCCAHCGQPIDSRGFLEKKGKPYHPQCFHERFSPRCHACGQPIEGKYLRALGKIWHPEHFVCTHCGKPIEGNFSAHRGKPYCKEHYLLLFAEKCSLCGKPLEGDYLVDLWGNKVCKSHEQEPRCSCCARFIGMQANGKPTRYADGRILCQSCAKTAVHEVSDAYALMKDVQKVLARHEFHFDRKLKIPLKLVSKDEIQSGLSKRRRARNTTGLAQTSIQSLFGVESEREIRGVLLLDGLPPEHLGATLAHELGHVWLFVNRFPGLPAKLEEGLCELMASYWLKTQSSELAKIRLRILEKNPDRVYGTGYRSVRKAVEHTSLAYVLDHIKRYASLPKV